MSTHPDYRVLEAEVQLGQIRVHRLEKEVAGIRRELDAAITALKALLSHPGEPHVSLKAYRALRTDLEGNS